MKTQHPVANGPVIFIADDDQLDDQYLYRQAFGEACPSAVVYFFTHKAQLFDAMRGDVFPEPSLLIMDWHMALRKRVCGPDHIGPVTRLANHSSGHYGDQT